MIKDALEADLLSKVFLNQILEPSKLPILQFFAIFPRCLQQPLLGYIFPQMIL